MSLSTIIDTIHAEMDTLFSASQTVIPNPYSLADNPSIFLKRGYGLQINGEANSAIDTLKDDNASRQFTFILTREVFRTEDDFTNMRTESKAILADQRSFKDRILDFDQLGIDNDIQRVTIIALSGVNFLVAEKFNYITTSLNFAVEYFTAI